MSCYSCGSPQGTIAVLCPQCVSRAKQRHGVLHQNSLNEFFEHEREVERLPEAKRPAVLPQNWLRAIALIATFIVTFIILKKFGPETTIEPFRKNLIALLFASLIVIPIAYIWLWMQMLLDEEQSKLSSFFCLIAPPVVWAWAARHSYVNRSIYLAQFIALAFSLAIFATLTVGLKVPPQALYSYMKELSIKPENSDKNLRAQAEYIRALRANSKVSPPSR